jgi:NAD-dependent DNA ligase
MALTSLPTQNADHLAACLANWKDAYFNTSNPTVSDEIYDRVEDQLRTLAPNHPLLQSVGAPVRGIRARLPFQMPSLDKVRTKTAIEAFSQKTKGSFELSEKLDGVSLGLVEKDGEWRLYTRGDGTFGQDISGLAQYLELPAPIAGVMVRAELVLPKAIYETYYKERYTSPRAAVAALVNSKAFDSTLARASEVVAYEVVKPGKMSAAKQFAWLVKRGFTVAAHRTVEKLDNLEAYLQEREKESAYAVDGVVIAALNVARPVAYKRPIR